MVDQKPGYLSPGFRTPGDKVHQKKNRAAVVRRRRLLLVGAAVAIVAVALVTALVWPGFARQADPLPEVTVTAPPPTPTAEAEPLPEGPTEFLTSLPETVLQLVRLDVAEDGDRVDETGAVEAWTVVYGDGSGTQVDLAAGQWADDDAASEVHDVLLQAAGEPTISGDVTVGDEVVGTYAVTPGGTAGTSVVTWRNGTAVFRATGPDQLVQDFYESFPM
ncbi:hypothetical protein ATJ88_0740 [Isoptericola jiangsuensis]|uniref:Uncharacterized protein n=1 Tax=Isoptericola jiangsuensis TaxID=548579 RepID=A0A2A9EUX8_9MICO|nr:hypothetical protein [Isoptericola jiangsuensis]PFG42090.1 hypothetical protein ATJ88_0740 [Isoptericola jiangsuensis]